MEALSLRSLRSGIKECRSIVIRHSLVEYPEFKAVVMLTCKSQGRLIGLDIDQGFLLALPYGICPG